MDGFQLEPTEKHVCRIPGPIYARTLLGVPNTRAEALNSRTGVGKYFRAKLSYDDRIADISMCVMIWAFIHCLSERFNLYCQGYLKVSFFVMG